jgi:hypothetical protein
MRIGFVGAGNIGSTLARLAVKRGHDVVVSNSRGGDTLRDLVAELGDHARPASSDQAVRDIDLVVVAIPLKDYLAVPAPAPGTVVVDTNNYSPARDGKLSDLDRGDSTSSQLLAAHLAEARVVKAFNTIYFGDLASQGSLAGTDGRRALPIAGDDADAKQLVSRFIDDLGFDVVDAGPLQEGRRFQPGTPAYNVRLTAAELAQALRRA